MTLCENFTSPLVIAVTINQPRMSASDKLFKLLPSRSERPVSASRVGRRERSGADIRVWCGQTAPARNSWFGTPFWTARILNSVHQDFARSIKAVPCRRADNIAFTYLVRWQYSVSNACEVGRNFPSYTPLSITCSTRSAISPQDQISNLTVPLLLQSSPVSARNNVQCHRSCRDWFEFVWRQHLACLWMCCRCRTCPF